MFVRPIRILHIIGQLQGGGCETQLLGMCRRLDRQRFDSSICWYGPMANELDEEFRSAGVRTIFFNKFSMPLWKFFLTLRQRIKDVSPDIVHTWLTSANFWGRWAAVTCGVPQIVASERSLLTGRQLIPGISERLLANRSHRLANSKVAAKSVERYSGLPAERIRIVYNAVSLEPCDRAVARAEIRRELGVPVSSTLALMIAHLRPGKNYPMFVRTAARVCRERSDVVFLSLGDGPLRGELNDLVQSLGVQNNVRFVGERRDIHRWLAAADLFCFTTDFEAFPNSVLEAMMAGLPVVSTGFSSMDELQGGQRNAVIVPFDDDQAMAREILALLDDPARRQQLGESGRSWVSQRYTWDALIRTMEAFYQGLHDSPRGSFRRPH